MRSFRVLVVLVACGACMVASAVAQGVIEGPEVDASEVRRRGDYVEHIRPGVIENAEAWSQIASLPDSDVDKFQIIVVGRKDCVPCKQLAEKWKTDPTLRTWARPDDKAKSWAAFHYVRYDDPLQQWRFKGPHAPKIELVPTIIIQPPRSGKYGDPRDIIHQFVYRSDPQAWADSMQAALKAYHASLQRRRVNEPQNEPEDEDDVFRRAEADLPFAQQQIPPLDWPMPDAPGPDDRSPVIPPPDRRPQHDGHLFGARREAVVVVTDSRQVYGSTVQEQIDATIQQVTGGDSSMPIYKIDLTEAKKYGVEAEELPVVLKVDGRDRVMEKRLPRVEQQKTFWGPLLSMWMGVGSLIKLFFTIVGLVIMIVFLVLAICFIVWFLRRLGLIAPNGGWPTPQPAAQSAATAPAAQATAVQPSFVVAPADDYDAMIERRKKQLEYEELTAKLQAAKVSNATVAKPASE